MNFRKNRILLLTLTSIVGWSGVAMYSNAKILHPKTIPQDKQTFTHTCFCCIHVAPQVIPDWLIKMPTAWNVQKRVGKVKVPRLGVSARDHKGRKREEREKEATMGVGGS